MNKVTILAGVLFSLAIGASAGERNGDDQVTPATYEQLEYASALLRCDARTLEDASKMGEILSVRKEEGTLPSGEEWVKYTFNMGTRGWRTYVAGQLAAKGKFVKINYGPGAPPSDAPDGKWVYDCGITADGRGR
ncbi:MAG: hypothetical protein COT74_13960 [Bdellovibrionales bacterium CG10_big_fil_rev_8_21_14_0_10_45_34]|nr:MAG: hypothetical protein COT74_13960 [Bdellovibrionales bacterium CG10_big_fil_rev_8_21_14_0_10_45_34]